MVSLYYRGQWLRPPHVQVYNFQVMYLSGLPVSFTKEQRLFVYRGTTKGNFEKPPKFSKFWKFSICLRLSVRKPGKYFPVQTKQMRLIRFLLYGFWFFFFYVFSAVFVFRCCRLPYLWACWCSFMFTPVRHSFPSLIDKQLSRKATLMFQDVLLSELSQKIYT